MEHVNYEKYKPEQNIFKRLTYLLKNLHIISATFSQFFLVGQKTKQE